MQNSFCCPLDKTIAKSAVTMLRRSNRRGQPRPRQIPMASGTRTSAPDNTASVQVEYRQQGQPELHAIQTILYRRGVEGLTLGLAIAINLASQRLSHKHLPATMDFLPNLPVTLDASGSLGLAINTAGSQSMCGARGREVYKDAVPGRSSLAYAPCSHKPSLCEGSSHRNTNDVRPLNSKSMNTISYARLSLVYEVSQSLYMFIVLALEAVSRFCMQCSLHDGTETTSSFLQAGYCSRADRQPHLQRVPHARLWLWRSCPWRIHL